MLEMRKRFKARTGRITTSKQFKKTHLRTYSNTLVIHHSTSNKCTVMSVRHGQRVLSDKEHLLTGRAGLGTLRAFNKENVFCKCVWLNNKVCSTGFHLYRTSHVYGTSIFTRLTPGELEEFCRSHADLSF